MKEEENETFKALSSQVASESWGSQIRLNLMPCWCARYRTLGNVRNRNGTSNMHGNTLKYAIFRMPGQAPRHSMWR